MIECIIITICSILLILIVSEVQIWSFTLNRHAYWLKKHPELDRRNINYKSLFYTSMHCSILSLITLLLWIFAIVMGNGYMTITFTVFLFAIILGYMIIFISFLSLIAKLCRLNKNDYPPLTTILCKIRKIAIETR